MGLLHHGALVKGRGLVGELMGRKRLRMLHAKGIGILKVVRAERMVVEAMQMRSRCDLAGVNSAFRGGQRQWGA